MYFVLCVFCLCRTVQNSDVHTLLACVDDVTTGDVSQEDIDPQLYKALQIAQYSSQYLLSSRKVMKEKEAVLKMALKTFQEEEELLDLKLAKLRARDKALRREARDLDDLTVEYSSALREVNPKLVNRLYKTYQDKLRQPSPDELARLANEDLRNWEADDRSSWSPRGEEPRRRGGGQLRHRDDRSPDWSTDDQRRDYEGGSLEAKESWRTGRVVDLSTQRHRGEERTVLTAVERPGGGEKADQYGWSRGSTSSHHQQTTAASTMPNSSMAAWASVRDTREASRENVGNGKSSASDVLRPPEEKSSHLQQAGWKSTVEVSHKPGATAVPSRYGRRDENVAALLGDASTEDSDYDSAVERRRIEISGAKLQRLASKSEFVKQSSPPAQPMIRTLSMRPVAVSSDAAANIDSGKHAAARASVPSPPPSVPERSVPGPVDVVVVAGSTPPLRKPTVSSSVDVSDNTWSATTQTLKAAIPPVLQSTDMSTKTVMSVDSLTLPDIRQEGPAPASYQRAPRSSIDDLTNNSESYEAVDLSSFIQAARQYDTNRSFGSGSYGNDIGISERVISAESHHSTTREAIERQQSDDPDASLMVEEFDDSVHMDHHPVGHAQATVARVAHSTPSASTSTPGAAATPTPAHSQASLPPLSASKYTPKRDYTFQDHQEREQSSSVEYSVEGDSPFPNLSGGAKDYNRVMRQNNSHISSNNSSSRNLSNLQQSTNNSNLLNQSGAVSQNSNTSASYEFDTFEDEDDPFARGPGPRKTIEFSNISGASSDVDASKSILIDFMLPSESKDPNRGGGGCGAESKNFQPQQQYPQRDQSYDETDASGDIGMFSPLARPRSNGHLGRADDDEDDVLMGTTKISFGNTAGGGSHNFTRTGTGTGSGLGSHNNPTGQFEKDSLGGTGYSSHHDSRKASNFSPQFGSGGGGVERDQDTEEEDSIPPPTYDSIIGGTGGTGGTEESYNNLRASQASQSEDVSSYFDSSAAVDADASAPHIHAVESAVSALKGPAWQLGRAQVDAVELARALDVFVSAVRLDAQHARIYSEVSNFWIGMHLRTLIYNFYD